MLSSTMSTTMTKTDIDALEGWLVKKTQKDGNSLFAAFKSGDNRRWFKVREVRSYENVELALCYFKTNKDKDARGWIYLKDVTDIIDDGFMFTIVSSARTMHLEAHSKAEHRLWLQGIVNLCPNANTSRIQCKFLSNNIILCNSNYYIYIYYSKYKVTNKVSCNSRSFRNSK